jgi:hypothetical protein
MGESSGGKAPVESVPQNAVDVGKAVEASFTVANLMNQPCEIKILGVWYRWEPRGMAGSSLSLSAKAVGSEDFSPYKQRFSITGGK